MLRPATNAASLRVGWRGFFQSERGVVGAILRDVQAVVGEILEGRFDHAHVGHHLGDVHGVIAAGHLEQQIVQGRGRRHGVAHQGHDEAASSLDVHDAGDVHAEVVDEAGGLGDDRRGRVAADLDVLVEHGQDAAAGRPGRRATAVVLPVVRQRLVQREVLQLLVHVLHGVELAGVVVRRDHGRGRRHHGQHVVLGRGVRRVRLARHARGVRVVVVVAVVVVTGGGGGCCVVVVSSVGGATEAHGGRGVVVRPAEAVARQPDDQRAHEQRQQQPGAPARPPSVPVRPPSVARAAALAAGLQQQLGIAVRRRRRRRRRLTAGVRVVDVVHQRHFVRLEAGRRQREHGHGCGQRVGARKTRRRRLLAHSS